MCLGLPACDAFFHLSVTSFHSFVIFRDQGLCAKSEGGRRTNAEKEDEPYQRK